MLTRSCNFFRFFVFTYAMDVLNRTSLNEVTSELAERSYRWKQIEMLVGFNIINNSGLAVLESMLYRNQANGRGAGLRSEFLLTLLSLNEF